MASVRVPLPQGLVQSSCLLARSESKPWNCWKMPWPSGVLMKELTCLKAG